MVTRKELKGLTQSYPLKKGQSILLEIGPLKLAIHHDKHEWALAYDWVFSEEYETPTVSFGSEDDFREIDKNIQRFATNGSGGKVNFKPKLADRSIVAKPRVPFHLVSHQELWLYVSSPVWLSITIGEDETQLTELPVHRPSDTWFGSNTIEGEIAYSVKTHARLALEEINKSRYRAITPVKLINKTDKHLFLERISLPVPSLKLYQASSYTLWTSSITLLREEDNDTSSIRIEAESPSQADEANLISEPRIVAPANVFIKTMSSLFR